MSNMSNVIFCMVNSRDHADLIVNHLRDSGFDENSISVMVPDRKGDLEFSLRHGSKAPEGASAGMATGGLIGGGIGWIAGIGVLAIPGLGPLMVAGPLLMAVLSGVAVGAAVGGVAGALIGIGIPEFEAKLYEGKLKSGGILIAVHCKNGKEDRRVRQIVHDGGAHDITSAGPVRSKAVAGH